MQQDPKFLAAAAAVAAARYGQPQKMIDTCTILRVRGRRRRLVISIIDWVDLDGHYG